MTAKDLNKFITENNVEYHYRINKDRENEEDVLIFPYDFQLRDFMAILTPCIFDDDGIECVLKDGYVAIWMYDICAYYGIELSEVFEK